MIDDNDAASNPDADEHLPAAGESDTGVGSAPNDPADEIPEPDDPANPTATI